MALNPLQLLQALSSMRQQGGGQLGQEQTNIHGRLGEIGTLAANPQNQGNMNNIPGLLDALAEGGGQPPSVGNMNGIPELMQRLMEQQGRGVPIPPGGGYPGTGDGPQNVGMLDQLPPILKDAILRRLTEHPQRMVS